MNKLKFNSQVCTTREQSEKLLALGLKPETADMSYYKGEPCLDSYEEMECPYDKMVSPAWSLHRLLDMIPNVTDDGFWAFSMDNINCWYNSPIDDHEDFEKGETIYDNVIDCIEWLISEGYFNKEYLKQ